MCFKSLLTLSIKMFLIKTLLIYKKRTRYNQCISVWLFNLNISSTFVGWRERYLKANVVLFQLLHQLFVVFIVQIVWIFTAYTFDFMNQHTIKSGGLKSGEYGAHSLREPRPISYREIVHREISRLFCVGAHDDVSVEGVRSEDPHKWATKTTNNWCSYRNNATYACSCLSRNLRKVEPMFRFTEQLNWNSLAISCTFNL